MKLRGNVLLKKLDRYIGIPVLKILSLFHSKTKCPKSVERVAILLTPAIGDTILTQSLLRDIKQYDPFIHITLYLPVNVVETAKLIGYSDELIPLNYSEILNTVKTIRKKEHDVFIDAGQWTRLSAIFTFFAKAKYKRGFETGGQFRHYGFDEAIHHNDAVHEVMNLRNLCWGHFENAANLPAIEFSVPRELDNKRVIIHMKSGGTKSHRREWDNENWAFIIRYLHSKGFTTYLSGSKNDEPSIKELMALCGECRVVNDAGRSITGTAELLRNSFLMISVNTGIMHLGAAVGINLIALHGAVNYLRWGPLNKNSISITSPYHGAPCLNLGFEYACKDKTGECMKMITRQTVINAIDKFLAAQ